MVGWRDMPFSRLDSCHRLSRLLFSSAAASPSGDLLPWLPPAKPSSQRPKRATNTAVAAAAENSHTRQATATDAQGDAKQLFALFSLAARQPGFRHNHPSYKALVSKLVHLEGLEAVHRILFSLRKEKLPHRPAILVALTDVCFENRLPVKPIGLLLSSTPVHEKVFVRVVKALTEAGRLETAKSFFSNDELISKLGFPLRVRHYIELVRACCERGEVPTAVELLDEMSQRGLAPDVFSYSSVVAAAFRGGSVDEALAVVEQMRKAGREPDRVVYNALVHGCLRAGKVERAEAIVEGMEEGTVGCDAGAYNTLMGGAESCHGVDGVKVLRRMMGRAVKPDVITFTALFSWLRREAREAEAGAPLAAMVKMGIRPNGLCRKVLGDGGFSSLHHDAALFGVGRRPCCSG